MIFVDTNIFMYAAGPEHPFKGPSLAALNKIVTDRLDALIDAEVLQEILHRYRAIGRWEEGREVFDMARRVVPVVAPITAEVVVAARSLLDRHQRLGARDALHAAVAREVGAEVICSYDRDFAVVPGLVRVDPEAILLRRS